ncbi:MAG: two-component system, cell cycle response regulator [Chloroflexota bacterium]|jgi:diguanylate cyclase (GGDEF)-like protein|nr:two-component system, cell cycle response regulator [Chloroflexota bacterium]
MTSETEADRVRELEGRIHELESYQSQIVAYAEDLNRTYQELRLHLQQMTQLNGVATELARTHSVASSGQACVQGLATLFPGAASRVYVLDDEGQLKCLAALSPPRIEGLEDAFDAAAEKVLHEESIYQVKSSTEQGRLHLVGMGLRARGLALGCFVVGILDQSFSDNDVQMLEILGHGVSVAVENAYLYEEASRLAVTDPATGLYNYRHFRQSLDQEVQRARRLGYPIGAIMADVDNFKAFNDTYGHPIGNLVLQAVARAIARSLRQTDTVARYGGEEFAAILPGCDREALVIVTEKVRGSVAQTAVPIDDAGNTVSVTISVGGEWQLPDEADADELLRAADKAMFTAKAMGRNRAHVRP